VTIGGPVGDTARAADATGAASHAGHGVPQPLAHGTARQGQGRPGQRPGISRVRDGPRRQVVQQRRFLPEDVGLARQHWHQITPGDRRALREQFVPHPVAQERRVVVARVLDPFELEHFAQ
jgi:hypothetical protein